MSRKRSKYWIKEEEGEERNEEGSKTVGEEKGGEKEGEESAKGKRKRKHIVVKYEEEASPQKGGLNWEPIAWKEVLENIKKMREGVEAPVDTMGAEQCYDRRGPEKEQRFQALVSLMLSSQTNDKVTHAAMLRLRAEGLTASSVNSMSEQRLGELIRPVGFWKTKAKHIKEAALVVLDDYGGDIPQNVVDLCKLRGVGPKMAHLLMKIAWHQITGIAVDTHVHRISNRLGWVPEGTKTPVKTMEALEGWLPREHWEDINHLLVGFGQMICSAKAPQCSQCLNRAICPSAQQFLKTTKSKSTE